MEQKIVNLASGQHYTLVVTDQGKLYGWGKRFLENVNQTSADPVELKLPKDMLARRVWAPGTVADSENAVVYLELEDLTTKKKQIYSAGKSEKGMLGQGDKVKTCSEFTKIYYESDEIEYT
jgi:alpha-tubulin suppressor-like RCC1 family protein